MRPFEETLKNLTKWFDHFIHEEYRISQEGLALFRISYAAFFLLFGLPSFTWITQNPDIFFNPPKYSLASLFLGFPPPSFLIGLDLLLVTCFIFLFFGYKTKLVSITITIL